MLENINEIYEKVRSFAKVLEPLQKQPWGIRDFRIEDPFGYYLRITQPHDILDKKWAVK